MFLDLETTGVDEDRHCLYEIGLILRHQEPGDTAPPVDVEYSWMIRPDLFTADPFALRIGRYHERINKFGLHIAEYGEARVQAHPQDPTDTHTSASAIASEVALLLDGARVVGAVPWFDEKFIHRFLRENGQAATNHYHLVDVEALAAGASGMQPPWDFNKVLAAYGLKYDESERHTALGDARMARDLYDAVYEQHRGREAA